MVELFVVSLSAISSSEWDNKLCEDVVDQTTMGAKPKDGEGETLSGSLHYERYDCR